MFTQGMIEPFWDDRYKSFDFQKGVVAYREDLKIWLESGYTQECFSGAIYDMRDGLPEWTNQFLSTVNGNNIGLCFLKMTTGNIIPYHKDLYNYYKKIFNLDNTANVWRTIIFLEDWKPGHIFEIEDTPITDWKAGHFVTWKNDAIHMAANLGSESRYTAQLTYIK